MFLLSVAVKRGTLKLQCLNGVTYF